MGLLFYGLRRPERVQWVSLSGAMPAPQDMAAWQALPTRVTHLEAKSLGAVVYDESVFQVSAQDLRAAHGQHTPQAAFCPWLNARQLAALM